MWEQVKMPNRHFLRSDIFTFVMVYSFYFLLVGSRRNECNSFWGERWGRNQKAAACSEGRGLFWYCLRDVVNDDKMISQLSLYMVNLSLYIKVTTLFFVKWQSSFSLLLVKSEKIIFGRYIFRASRRLLTSPPYPAKKQKKEIIPYPRCGFGACLRCGWAS